MTFAVSFFAAGSLIVSAKPHTASNISEVGGVRAKAVHYRPESNPKYSDEYKSKRISKLIGHKTHWRKIRDNRSVNHFVLHNANNLGNLLIRGKTYQWNSFIDSVHTIDSHYPVDNQLGEYNIDPSMVPIRGNGRKK
ncbi:MAG: hypothetical protein SFY67_15080 [Candidatus Melainabacteria bacterium]|nr:hypothetical protein [Candidatus Melainabacteria bacterium]